MNFKESFKKSFKDINPLSLGVGALTGLNSAIGFNNRGAGAVAQGLSQIKTGNPFVDMGIQGASMLLNQFGYNVNEQLKNDIENNIAENNSFQSNAGDWDSFLSNYNSAPTMKYWTPDQLVKRGIFNTSGGRGLINSLAQQQAQSGNWVSNSLALNADNIIQDDINNDWRNFNNPINIGAKGGLLHTLGTEWDNGLTFINNGGTHEENPNQGVQVGVDPKGTPNLVEEGEVIWNDYVFSNRLKVPKETVNKYKLGGSKKDYTYAEVVEKLQRASEERPNDPLEKRYLEEMLAMLMEEQEMVRQQQQEEEQAQQQLAMQEALQDPAVQEQLMQEQLAQENMMQDNMMGIPMMAANGGELYGLGGNLFQRGSFLNKKHPSKAVGYFKSIAGAGNVTTSAEHNGGYYKTKYVVNTKLGQINIYEDHNGKLYTEENAKEGAGGVVRYKKSILIRDPKSTKALQQRITKQGLRWPKKVTGISGHRYNKDTNRYDIPIYQTYTHPGNGSAIIIEDQATHLRRSPGYRGNLPNTTSNNINNNKATKATKPNKLNNRNIKIAKKEAPKLSPPLFSEPEDPRWLEFTDPIIGAGSAYGMLNFAGNPIEMGESYYNPPIDNMAGVNSIPIPTSESMGEYSGLYPSIQQPRDPELNNLLQDLVAWNKARKEAGLSGEEAYDMHPYRNDISTALNALSLKEQKDLSTDRAEEVTTVENQETNEENKSIGKPENEVVRSKTINYTSTMSPFGNNPAIAINPLGGIEFPKIGVDSKYSYGGAMRNTFEKKENNPSPTNELASEGNFYDLGSFLGRMSPTVQQYLMPEIIMPASILSTTLSSKKKTSKSTNAASPNNTTTLPAQSKENQNKAVKSTNATTAPVTTTVPTSTTTATSKKTRQGKGRRKLPVGNFDLDMASLGINPNSIYSLDPEEFRFPPTTENGFWGSKALKIAKDAIEQAQQNVENTTESGFYTPDKIDEAAELAELGITDNDIIGAAADEDIDLETKKGTNWKSDPSYLKNTNAFASLAQVLSDAFGRTNTPDHSYANALQAAAANYPRVSVSPIGDRQAYTPRDIFNTLINPLYANSAGISSNLANSGNRGTQTVQQIALDRNLADAIGKAYATGVEGELASKKAVADYNANIDKINATMSMQAQQQNAANRQRYLNYLAQALAWKQQEDTQAAMARAANREALADNLTTIGQNIYDANAGNAITRYQRDPNGGSIIFIG